MNCVAFGKKTGTLLATGGDDRKLNVWSVGKPNVLLVSRQRCENNG